MRKPTTPSTIWFEDICVLRYAGVIERLTHRSIGVIYRHVSTGFYQTLSAVYALLQVCLRPLQHPTLTSCVRTARLVSSTTTRFVSAIVTTTVGHPSTSVITPVSPRTSTRTASRWGMRVRGIPTEATVASWAHRQVRTPTERLIHSSPGEVNTSWTVL